MGFDRRRFLEEQVSLATPAERLMMIWERLMLNLDQAHEAMGAGEHERANTELLSAQQILVILSGTLDQSWDGAANLGALYRFCWEKLVAANVRWDKGQLEEATDILAQLYEAWGKAAADVQPALATN